MGKHSKSERRQCVRPSKQRRTFISPEKLECSKCPYKTINRTDWSVHKLRHETANMACDVCNMPFMTRGYVEGHKLREHGIAKTKPVVRKFCTLCEYATFHYSDMTNHRRKHAAAEFHCRYCNYPFCHSRTLLIHMRKDHGKYLDVQNRLQNLKKEKKIVPRENRHSSETRLINNGWIISSKGKVINIDKTRSDNGHSIDKTSKKDTKFVYLVGKSDDDITEDNSTGQSEEPKTVDCRQSECSQQAFKCVQCVFRTSQHTVFQRHTNRHAKGKYSCDICLMPFMFKDNFEKHLKNKHGDQRTEINSAHLKNDTVKKKNVFHANPVKDEKSKRMNCAFCEFNTHSYMKLKDHLDSHDIVKVNDRKHSCRTLTKGFLKESDSNINIDSDIRSIHQYASSEDIQEHTSHGWERKSDNISLLYAEPANNIKYVGIRANRENEMKVMENDLCLLKNDNVPKEIDESEIKYTKDSVEEFSERLRNYDKGLINTNEGFQHSDKWLKDSQVKEVVQSNIAENATTNKKCLTRKRNIFSNKSQLDECQAQNVHNLNTIVHSRCDKGDIGNSDSTADYQELYSKVEEDRDNRGVATPSYNYKRIHKDITSVKPSVNIQKYTRYLEDKTNEWVVETNISSNYGSISNREEEGGDDGGDCSEEEHYLVGKLSKEDFKISRKLFMKNSEACPCTYQCLICETGNTFETLRGIWVHFKKSHKRLRQKICNTCAYCSALFPNKCAV